MKYKLYDPVKDTLAGMTEDESLIIEELRDSHATGLPAIIKYHFDTALDRQLFVERLTEIFNIYYKWGAFNIHPFSSRAGDVVTILQTLAKLDNNSDARISKITLSKTRGKRTDFIRVFNALYELNFFHDSDGGQLSKKDLMEEIGKFLGTDFSSYESDLSQSFSASVETNVKILEDMRKKIVEIHSKRQK